MPFSIHFLEISTEIKFHQQKKIRRYSEFFLLKTLVLETRKVKQLGLYLCGIIGVLSVVCSFILISWDLSEIQPFAPGEVEPGKQLWHKII